MKKFLWEIIGFLLLVLLVVMFLFFDPYKRSVSYRNLKFKQDWHQMMNTMEMERKEAYNKLEQLENRRGSIAKEDKAMLAYCRTSSWNASEEFADSVTFQSPVVGTAKVKGLPSYISPRYKNVPPAIVVQWAEGLLPIVVDSARSHIYHNRKCGEVKDIPDDDKLILWSSKEAINLNYIPCSKCRPIE